MVQVLSPVVLLCLMLCILPSHKAMAQQFSESTVVYEAARNKIGLIRYCRDNELIDPVIAYRAVSVVEAVLRKLPASEIADTELGDRAQKAGEEGFWETGRKRDIASIAKLFHTTPADLCKEWIDETLSAEAPRLAREAEAPSSPRGALTQIRAGLVKTITIAPANQPILPLAQSKPAPVELAEPAPVELAGPVPVELAPVEPTQEDTPPAAAPPVVRVVRSTPTPPLPEKAPFRSTEAELTSLQRTVPTSQRLGASGKAESGGALIKAAVIPGDTAEPSKRAAPPLPTRLAAEIGPLPGERPVEPPSFWDKLRFNPLGSRDRCLMPGCKWRSSANAEPRPTALQPSPQPISPAASAETPPARR